MDSPDMPDAVGLRATELAHAAHSYLRDTARTPPAIAAAIAGVLAVTSLLWAPGAMWSVPWTAGAGVLAAISFTWYGRVVGRRATSWQWLLGVTSLIGLRRGAGQAPRVWARCLSDAARATRDMATTRSPALVPAQTDEPGDRMMCAHTAHFASRSGATTVTAILVIHGLDVYGTRDGEDWVVNAVALVPSTRLAEHHDALCQIVLDHGGRYNEAGLPLPGVPEEHV